MTFKTAYFFHALALFSLISPALAQSVAEEEHHSLTISIPLGEISPVPDNTERPRLVSFSDDTLNICSPSSPHGWFLGSLSRPGSTSPGNPSRSRTSSFNANTEQNLKRYNDTEQNMKRCNGVDDFASLTLRQSPALALLSSSKPPILTK